MRYTDADLKNKILEMYPEIVKHAVGVDVTFDDKKDAYLLAFTRGTDVLTTRLEKHDADECVNGVKCVYWGSRSPSSSRTSRNGWSSGDRPHKRRSLP